MTVRVQSETFDPGQELGTFAKGRHDVGAVVSFTGVVRDDTGDLRHMLIEHYPAMTQSAIEAIEAEAVKRWSLAECLIIHRFGEMKPGEQIMMVATAAGHRADAFQACDFLMDYLKSRAPFWKKEVTKGGADWVASKTEDEDALKRW